MVTSVPGIGSSATVKRPSPSSFATCCPKARARSAGLPEDGSLSTSSRTVATSPAPALSKTFCELVSTGLRSLRSAGSKPAARTICEILFLSQAAADPPGIPSSPDRRPSTAEESPSAAEP